MNHQMSRIVTPQDPLNWCGKQLHWPLSCQVGPGLHGLIAAASPVAWVNAEGRTLEYRGIRIEELLHHPDFEYGSHLLIYGVEKEQGQLESFRHKIRSSRSLPASIEHSEMRFFEGASHSDAACWCICDGMLRAAS